MSSSVSKSLCIELVTIIYGWILGEYEDDLMLYEGFHDYGSSYLEWGCGALAQVGVFEYDIGLRLYRPKMTLDAIHEKLSFNEFDEPDLNHLLHAFCFREMNMQQALGIWNETFNVPEQLTKVMGLLAEAGYAQIDDPIANWCPAFLPWLAGACAIDLADLPAVEPLVAQKAWESLPEELKTLVLEKPGTAPESNLVFLCRHRNELGWSEIAGLSTVPTHYWNVPLVYAALQTGLHADGNR